MRNIDFKLDEKSLSTMEKLPRYNMGLQDLKENDVVTIAYTANTFIYNANRNTDGVMSIAFNVQAVFYHGHANED